MKRIICFISLVLAMSMLLSVPVLAEESGTFSSLYFTSYDSFIYIPSGRTLVNGLRHRQNGILYLEKGS